MPTKWLHLLIFALSTVLAGFVLLTNTQLTAKGALPHQQANTLTVVGTLDTLITDIAIKDGYGYGISEDFWFNQVIDLANPSMPTAVPYNHSVATSEIEINGDLLYVAGQGKLRIFSLVNPAAPTQLSELSMGIWTPSDFKIHGDLAVSDNADIFDISDPRSPRLLSHINTEFGGSIEVAGPYVYVMGARSLEIIDISSPSSPFRVSTLDIFPAYKGLSMGKIKDYLVISSNDSQNSVVIVDVSNPAQPTVVSRIENGPSLHKMVFEGSTGYVICKDIRTFVFRLCIYDFSTPLAPVRITDHELTQGAYALTAQNGYIYVAEGKQLTTFKYNQVTSDQADRPIDTSTSRQALPPEPPPGLSTFGDLPLYPVYGAGDVLTVPALSMFAVYVPPLTEGDQRAEIRWTSGIGVGKLDVEAQKQSDYGTNLLYITTYEGKIGSEATIAYNDGRFFIIRIADPAKAEPTYQPPRDAAAVLADLARQVEPTPAPTPTPVAPVEPALCTTAPKPTGAPIGQLLLKQQAGDTSFALLDIATTHLSQITAPGVSYYGVPVWSPDGQQLAFIDHERLFVMDADGQNQRQVSDLVAADTPPSWSPDGQWLLFSATQPKAQNQLSFGFGAADLYLIRPDSSDLTQLTSDPQHNIAPRWSPDGKRIVYTAEPVAPGVSNFGPDAKVTNIDVLDLQTGNTIQITADKRHSVSPVWSPDGTQIAFVRTPVGVRLGATDPAEINEHLYLVQADGSGLRQLTPDALRVYSPSWSPNGEWLAFAAMPDRGNKPKATASVYIMRVDGRCWRQVTPARTEGLFAVTWSPTDSQLAILGHQERAPLLRSPLYGDILQWVDVSNSLPQLKLLQEAPQQRPQFSLPSWRPACARLAAGCALPEVPLLAALHARDFSTPAQDDETTATLIEREGIRTTEDVNPPPSFTADPIKTTLSQWPNALATGDFNQDGYTDAVTLNHWETLTIFLGDGNGALTAVAEYPVAKEYTHLLVSDLNADGMPDIIHYDDYTAILTVLWGEGEGNFTPLTYAFDTARVSLVGIEDLNQDGQNDLVLIEEVSLGQESLLLVNSWDGESGFARLGKTAIQGHPFNFLSTLGDVNGDNHPDMITLYGGSLVVYYGDGLGNFSDTLEISTANFKANPSNSPHLVETMDLNADGVLDMVIAADLAMDNKSDDTYGVAILLSAGTTNYLPPQLITTEQPPQLVDIHDVNQDGYLDILAVGQFENETTWLLGQDNGRFRKVAVPPLSDALLSTVTAADMNNDGKPDYIATTTNPDTSIQIWLTP